jgi:antitoxin CcdA
MRNIMRMSDAQDDPMQDKPARKKKAVNLSIDAELVAEAREFGTNLSATLERALREAHRESRLAKWREENRAAIEAHNRFVAENGLLSEEWRKF